VLWANVVLASPEIALALHSTKQVPVDNNVCSSPDGFVQVVFQELPVAMGVVPMEVRNQQKFDFSMRLKDVDV
jgi:hypothetical protein